MNNLNKILGVYPELSQDINNNIKNCMEDLEREYIDARKQNVGVDLIYF